jgi:hypothetical protein
VAPAKAGERLCSGAWVKLEKGVAVNSSVDDAIGVVDPFLENTLELGDWFYIFMKPGSVMNMRHEWDHPAFGNKEEAIAWLTDFAKVVDMDYDQLIEALTEVQSSGRRHILDYDTPDECYTQRNTMWYYFSIVTGIIIDSVQYDESAFECAC